ncbi:hypothetical protein Aperf_G00000069162 [Anoplocephala perfoliata]
MCGDSKLFLAFSEMHEDNGALSVDCILPPFNKTTASAKTQERAKEIASRLMFHQLKKSENSAIGNLSGTKSMKRSRNVDNIFRGSSDYSGSLHPVERLELIQRANRQSSPAYTFEELRPPIKVSLPCDEDKVLKSRCGPIKFRCTCQVGENIIQGDVCCNKRLAKRSAAEKALRTLGINAYPHLTCQTGAKSHLLPIDSLKSGTRVVDDSAVTFSCAREVFIFATTWLTYRNIKDEDIRIFYNAFSDENSLLGLSGAQPVEIRSRSGCRSGLRLPPSKNKPRSASTGMDIFAYGLNLLNVGSHEDSGFATKSIGLSHDYRQDIMQKEEKPIPNPLREVVSWQLLASLGRFLLCQESGSNSCPIDSNAIGLDSQLLQLCNRFSIPCQLVELSSLEEGGKVPVSPQMGKFHKFAESDCAFLLQIGRNHLVPHFLPSSEDLMAECPQTIRLECGHAGRGGCFLSTGANRMTCRQNLASHVLKCLDQHPAQCVGVLK